MRRISHNARYGDLQKDYLKSRDDGILTKMYDVAKEAAYNYLNKYCRKKGIRLRNLDEMAHDSAMFIIDQYLRKPDFKILRLSAYIYFGVIKTLFKNKGVETRELSYEETVRGCN